MTAAADRRFMALALSLGRRGLGQVWPNPAVGCAIVKDGIIVGRATTAPGGRPHAETQALAQAGSAAHGAVAYVTLEPCAHYGQTPPCAQALIGAGVSRVVVATGDPDARVAGQGIAMLRGAGITVDEGVMAAEARVDNAGFLKRITYRLPFVTLKLASTLDGRIATQTGESRWITGPEARHMVHAMRARHDAVVVGAGTAREDDPMLDVRNMGNVRQPVRVVLSRALHLPINSRLADTAQDQPLWLCHGPEAVTAPWHVKGAKTILVKLTDGQIDPASALQALADEGITRVFCEGGGHLASALLRAGLVDDLVMFQAGVVIGSDGTPSLAGLGVTQLDRAPRFRLIESRNVGRDIMHRWRPA